MKKFIASAIFALVLSASISTLAQTAKTSQLQTVASVDLKRYSGKWFEIARYPNKFEKQCVGNTTATYTIKDEKTIEVLNQCVKKDGTIDNAKGKARVVDTATNAKLEVRFAPAALSFLSSVWGKYWIIDLDENYQYTVVGDPKREYLWILSRTPQLNDTIYQNILRRIETLGFNPAKIIKTPQKLEVVKGAVIEKQ